jgi:hypothetical protein
MAVNRKLSKRHGTAKFCQPPTTSGQKALQWNLSGVATAFSEASSLLAKKVLVCEELRKFEQEWAVSKSGIQKTLERLEPLGHSVVGDRSVGGPRGGAGFGEAVGREKCLRNRLDKRHFWGLAWPRDAKPAPPGAAGSTVGQNRAKALPREAVWRIRSWNRRAKRKFRLRQGGATVMRASCLRIALRERLPYFRM